MKDIWMSLKKDKLRVFFCWLTLVITSMFIFLFFFVAMSETIGVTVINGKSDIPSILMISTVILCSIEIVFANDFFVKNKAMELAIRIVCGATYVQIATFLLAQVLWILLFALPIGIGTAFALLPMINFILNSLMNADTTIAINGASILCAIIALGFVLFWTMILNLSFAYRNNASQLLNSTCLKLSHGTSTNVGGKVGKILLKLVHLAIMIVPLFLSYMDLTSLFQTSPDNLMQRVMLDSADMVHLFVYMAMSLFGFLYLLDDFYIPFLDWRIHRKVSKRESLISLGFFRTDVRALKMNLVLNLLSSILLIMLLTMTDNVVDEILVLISYVCINALMALSLMFRFFNELMERKTKFKTLSHLGFQKKDEKHIITREVLHLNGYLIVMYLFYLGNTCNVYFSAGTLHLRQIEILAFGTFIPLLVCGIIEIIYYMRTVLKED